MRKLLIVLIAALTSNITFAQDFSNKGKEFWIPYSYHVSMTGAGANLSMTLYLTSDVTTTYQVEIFGGPVIQSGTINAGQVVTCGGGTTLNSYFINDEGLFNGKTIRVTSANPIVVYSYITQSAISGATVCLPTQVLGREYYSSNYTQISNAANANSYFTIIAVEDNTTINITPADTTKNGWLPGNTYPVTLNKGQIYQVLGKHNNTAIGGLYYGKDLTGSKIESVSSGGGGCKRIAVFSGAGKIRIGVCTSANTSDNLYQQLYPVASWGKKYLTAPSFMRKANYYRVIKKPSVPTNVFVNGALIPPASFVNGTYFEFNDTIYNKIEADQPISVSQYFTTQNCSGNSIPYDPDMIMLNPVEQNISKVTLVSSNLAATQYQQHHLHIIMRNEGTGMSSFRMDNVPVPTTAWTVHPQDALYSYLYLDSVAQGYHTLISDSGFNALAYGYANAESYGYSAGSNIKDLYQYVTIQNEYATVNFPATCRNTPFFFTMTFPYQPTSIQWQFNGLFPDFNMPDPSIYFIGTVVVNGKTLYQYKIPNPYNIAGVGSYPIRVVAINPTPDGCGNTQEIDYDIQVFDNPVADFNTSNVCFPDPVQFTDNSNTGGRPIIHRYWDFGDNTTGNASNPSHVYPAPGPPSYNARYSIITDVGCLSDTTTHPVTVNPLPTATIDGTIDVCQNGVSPVITFTGAVGTAPYTFTYNINGGAPQTVTTITGNSVTVTAPTNIAGTFVYNLVSVKDASPATCSQNQNGSATVIVNPLPTANLSGIVSVCQNATPPDVTFTGASGTAPYTFTYNINGGASQTVTTTTGNSATVLAPTGTVGTFVYNLVSVQDASSTACSQNQSGTFTVNVNALPTATIAGTAEVCKDAASPQITFTGSGTTAPYTFTYNINGSANQTVISSGDVATVLVPTNTAGTFTYNLVSVQDASSTLCSQEQTGLATVIVHPLPSPVFSVQATPICEEGEISFTDLSVPNVGNLSSWQWNFDDPVSGTNNSSTLQSPTHFFATAGTYNVTLSVTNDKGCVSNPVFSLPVVVNPKPLAGYIVPDVCLSDTYAQFTDTSHVSSPDNVNAWQWNFGDPGSGVNNSSLLQNPQHSYSATGSYDVELIATSNKGCKDTITHQLLVNGSFPVANFTLLRPANICANDSVAIVEASTVFPGVINKIEIYWDNIGQPTVFDMDDYPVTGRVYKHLYPNFQTPATRTYQVRYRAYSGGVCVNDKVQDITVHAAPGVVFWGEPNLCFTTGNHQITSAHEMGGVPGTGTFSGPGVTPTGIFNTLSVVPGGLYPIQFLWTSNFGCKDSITQYIKVLDTPSIRFSFPPIACEKSLVSFNSSASTSPTEAGNIVGWLWYFGDQSPTSSLQNPGHVFNQYGTYYVSLTVRTSAQSCISPDKVIPINVNPIPRPAFTVPASVCLPSATVMFNSSSSWIPGGTQAGFSYLWNFGDPGSGTLNTATASNPSHIYNTAQPYPVNLQITSDAGCPHDTTIIINNIHPQPVADFIVDKAEVCIGDAFTFTDNSNPMDGVTTNWFWTMDDGSTRSVRTFPYTYTTAGTYDVELYTINSHGCRSTTYSEPVTVHPYPVVDAGPDRFVLQDGQITLDATASGNDLTYLWTPNLYFISSSTILKPEIKGVDDIRYTLTVTARGGCADTSSVFIKVLKYPLIPNVFSPNGDGVHDRWVIGYLESYPGCTVDIYNRYGQLILHSEGYQTPWDGKVNGRDVPIGTYYYIVNPKNGRSILSGYVDVIR